MGQVLADAAFVDEERAFVDWWLMRRFPGKTPEELDEMDWFRFLRAFEIQRIFEVEQRRDLQIRGVIEAKDLDLREWETIELHDRLVEGDDG